MKKHFFKTSCLIFSIIFLALNLTLLVHANPLNPKHNDLLGQSKSILPTSQNSNILYSGFSTRVKNVGIITTIKMYYVLSKSSNLTCHIMDTNLNILYSTPSLYTHAGYGFITFTLNNFTPPDTEFYIALESDKKTLGIGTVQETNNITDYVTSNNFVLDMANAQKNTPHSNWIKKNNHSEKDFSLYLEVYGYSKFQTNSQKRIYVSSSYGCDKNDGLTPTTALKSISHALSIYKNNVCIYLKSEDSFFEPYGLQLNGCNNLTLSFYGGTNPPKICGLQPAQLKKIDNNLYNFSIPSDIGHLILSNQILWKRIMTKKVLCNNGEYYVNIANNEVTLYLETNPVDNIIYYANNAHGISLKNSSNICISNLEICNFGKHGISIGGYSTDITIHQNIIHDIGGATLNNVKYGNGIECWLNGLSNITITHNIVYNCFDAGITPQIKSENSYTNSNILINQNEIYNCIYPIEYFNSCSTNSSCRNIIISNNYIHDCIDITNGYRENAATSYDAFFCMWRSNGNDSIIITNNICINSNGHCISFLQDSSEKINFYNNTFVIKNSNTIKNPSYFYGINNNFINLSNTYSSNTILSTYQHQGLALIR